MTGDEIAAIDREWIGRVEISQPETYFDWQPFPVGQFTTLLQACLPHVPDGNRTFLDTGCGIGTKLLIAADHGLDAHGIDRVPEYLAEAARLGASVEQTLAEDYAAYGTFGLVYVNHPLATSPTDTDEVLLERLIHDQMTSGAVLLAVNYDLAPGCIAHPPGRVCDEDCLTDVYDGWTEIVRDGAWNAGWVKS